MKGVLMKDDITRVEKFLGLKIIDLYINLFGQGIPNEETTSCSSLQIVIRSRIGGIT